MALPLGFFDADDRPCRAVEVLLDQRRLDASFEVDLFAGALFLPPWIEAARETGPPIQMTWRARNRFVGPRVIEAIAAKIERGDLTTAVADATFEGFGA